MMIKKRYIIIAVGIISVLLASLLVNNIILAQSGGEYDPWLDYNEDGIIDVNDLSPLGQAYGSSGDPTKNVNVTNWPLDEQGNLKVIIAEKPPIVLDNPSIFVGPEELDNVKTFSYSMYGGTAQGTLVVYGEIPALDERFLDPVPLPFSVYIQFKGMGSITFDDCLCTSISGDSTSLAIITTYTFQCDLFDVTIT